MKRGWWNVLVMLLLSLPAVAADSTILGLLFGSSEDSMIFLRIIYGMTIFVFIYKVSIESLFHNAGSSGDANKFQKLALTFSVAFVLLAEHFTSDEVLQAFGWLVAFLGPVIILWGISGLFFKNRERDQGFNWARLLLTLLLVTVMFFMFGSTNVLSGQIGSMPGIGGGLSEFLQDLSFRASYEYGDYLFGALFVGLLIGLFTLGARLFGGRNREEGSNWTIPWKPIFVVLGIVAMFLLLSSLAGVGFAIPAVFQYLVPVLALLGILYILFKTRGPPGARYTYAGRIWAWLVDPNNRWALAVLGALLALSLISGLLYLFGGSIAGIGQLLINYWYVWLGLLLLWLLSKFWRNGWNWIRGGNIFVTLNFYEQEPPAGPGVARLAPRRVTIQSDMNGLARTIQLWPRDPNTPIAIRVKRGRTLTRSVRLSNATLNFTMANSNGSVTPATITTDTNGEAQFTLSPHSDPQTNALTIAVAHADIDPTRATPIPPYPVHTGEIDSGTPILTCITNPVNVVDGRDARFRINIQRAGAGVNGSQLDGTDVTINFTATGGHPAPTPITGKITAGGAGGVPSGVDITVPADQIKRIGQPYRMRITAKQPPRFTQKPNAITVPINVNVKPFMHIAIHPTSNITIPETIDATVRVHVGKNIAGGVVTDGDFNDPLIVEIRFPHVPVPTQKLTIPAAPGRAGPAEAIFTVPQTVLNATVIPTGTIVGAVTPGRHEFQIFVTNPPTGYRSPAGPANGQIDVDLGPALTISADSSPIIVQENRAAVFSGLVQDPTGTGVVCNVEISSPHPEISNRNFSTSGSGRYGIGPECIIAPNTLAPTHMSAPPVGSGLAAGMGRYFYCIRITGPRGYTFPADQWDFIQVTAKPKMQILVTWAPTVLSRNQETRVRFQVVDSITGLGINGIHISVNRIMFNTTSGGGLIASQWRGSWPRDGTQNIEILANDPTNKYDNISGQIQVTVRNGVLPTGVSSTILG